MDGVERDSQDPLILSEPHTAFRTGWTLPSLRPFSSLPRRPLPVMSSYTCLPDTELIDAPTISQSSTSPHAGPLPSPSAPDHAASTRDAHLWKRLVTDTWIPEIVALAFSTSCLIVIFAVLKVFDSERVPHLPSKITLNTIISILAPAFKSSLIFAVATTISQAKWCWFHQKAPRRLQDMQYLDDASRGPLGSTMMLLNHTALSLASVGALITILALAFDPFVQQVVSYPVRSVPDPYFNATTKRASAFLAEDVDFIDFTRAINQGIWTVDFERTPSCPSGNCTWKPFDSFGWCAKCIDRTAETKLDDCTLEFDDFNDTANFVNRKQCTVEFPAGNAGLVNITTVKRNATHDDDGNDLGPGWQVDSFSDVIWELNSIIDDPVPRGESEYYAGLANPLLVLGYAKLEFGSDRDNDMVLNLTRSSECALTHCVAHYTVQVENGNVSVDVSNVKYGHNAVVDSSTWYCWSQEEFAGQSFRYCPQVDYISNIASRITGNASMSYIQPDASDVGTQIWAWSSDSFYAITYGGTIENILPNVAASLTKFGLSLSNETLTGLSTIQESYVHVRWRWLILPVVLTATGIMFLTFTMLLTEVRKAKLWKNSALALIYHGLEQTDGTTQAFDTASAMDEAARKTYVKLTRSEKRASVVLKA